LTTRHGVSLTEEEVRQRYAYRNFPEFIEAFKVSLRFCASPKTTR